MATMMKWGKLHVIDVEKFPLLSVESAIEGIPFINKHMAASLRVGRTPVDSQFLGPCSGLRAK